MEFLAFRCDRKFDLTELSKVQTWHRPGVSTDLRLPKAWVLIDYMCTEGGSTA